MYLSKEIRLHESLYINIENKNKFIIVLNLNAPKVIVVKIRLRCWIYHQDSHPISKGIKNHPISKWIKNLVAYSELIQTSRMKPF